MPSSPTKPSPEKAPLDAKDSLNAKTIAERLSKNQKDKNATDEELSEEDQQLVNELEMLLERLKEPNTSLHQPALESLRTIIRTSTSSMTSVPKPLKFLRPHYDSMTELFDSWSPSPAKQSFAAILSVLGMTYADETRRDCLKYRFLASMDEEEIASWGHEYVRHLCAEIIAEHNARMGADESVDDLGQLALILVPFCLKHNAEHDAVDL
ncbi:proteasome regulatory particle base subunit, partial [Dimargaris xerosporica]